MNPEQWRQIERIYNRALELEPGRRAAFVEGACGEDESLRHEVERLLARQSQAEDFIESPAVEVAAKALATDQGPGIDAGLEGRTLLHYRIEARIGAGGMGVVYRARDTHLNRPVAIKVLPDVFAQDAERLARFEREARLLATLSHQNIAPIHGLERVDGTPFLVLDLVEGPTLEERLKKGPIPTDEALEICRQAAEGLEAAHDKGIIHRDLKPANIKLTAEGQVKILDFGLAKALHDPADSADLSSQTVDSMTASGVILGTVAYMSPEQASGKPVDRRTDIWAFGCVLYECLTARKAFEGETLTETVASILRDEPNWNALPKSTPPKVVDLLRRCLHKDPKERLHDIGDARIEIEEASPRRAAPVGRHPLRQRMRLWLGVAALFAILVIALLWHLSRQKAGIISEPLRIVPFTTLPGTETNAKFSPDGKFVAFQWNGPAKDNWDIYVKQVGREGQIRVTRDPAGEFTPAWSPDGSEIAFIRASGRSATIYRVPSLGGVEAKLYESRAGLLSAGLSWSPDGRWLAFSEKGDSGSPHQINLLSLDTRQKTPLTWPPRGPYGDYTPEFSPDGMRVAFRRVVSYAVTDLWLQPVTSGEATRLTHERYDSISRPAWTPDGGEVVFIAKYAAFRVPLTGGAPRAVPGIGEGSSTPAIWRNHLVFAQYTRVAQTIQRIPGPNYRGKVQSAIPILVSTREDHSPDYSPDGKRIVFASFRSGFSEIWTCESEGNQLVQLTNLRRFSGTPRWSPDGKRIAFDHRPEDDSEIYVINENGGIPRRLTNDKSEDQVPSWSRDGRWIYFSSNRSGSYQVWKMPPEGGKAVQVTKGGGFYAVESFDGKMLFYSKLSQSNVVFGTVWQAALDGSDEAPLLNREIHWGEWAVRPEGIYFATRAGKKHSISLLSFQTGRMTTFRKEDTPYYRFYLTMSPDGQWFLYTEIPPRESDLMLVENFR